LRDRNRSGGSVGAIWEHLFVRWDNLKMTTEEEERLPGYSDPAVIRHFDAPEAMGVKFYEVRAKSALNRVPEISQVPFRWTINPYRGCSHACVFCFARPTHEYLDMNARDDFDKKIVVKVNLPEVLRRELNRPSWKGEHVALGTNTDPYQWVEKRYRLTRGVWEAMRDFKNPCSVLTKSPLLLRDLDLFQEIAAVASFTANLSIPTIDEKVWRQTEPHTPNPRARIEAVAELTRAGIQCGVLVAPLIPGVNDDPAQVQAIVDACVEAGASHIGGICLHLRGAVKDIWFEWLEAYRPDLIPRYEQMYARGAYAPKAERERIMNLVRDARQDSAATQPPDYRLRPRRPVPKRRAPAGRLMRGGLAETRSSRRADEIVDDGAPIQQSLF
jgi:DNA repair photolyase